MRVMVLFTRDLRTHDHPALWEATRVADDVVPLFVVDPALIGRSANRDRFLAESLVDLDRSLAHRGGRLLVRDGPVAPRTVELATEAGCDEIFLTNDAGAYARRRADELTALAAARRIGLRTFPGHAVVEPGAVTPQGADAYRVFTPYLRAWHSARARDILPSPRRVRVPRGLEAGRLPIPERYRPSALEIAPGGETAGRKRMQRFLADDARTYEEGRDVPAGEGTSRLSPYLRFGCISAAELSSRARGVEGAGEFVRQLAWRDFFGQLLAHRPTMTWEDLRPGVESPSTFDDAILDAWVAGRTGLPLVDAGMRQLAREGWMHNRARLVTASFLTRRAGVPWQVGARHFFEHLVDGDPANNAGNWQWVAGTGASPRRGRPLSPVRQAQRFDPDGAYVRRYVPELARATSPAILRPWSHPELLRASGYPAPIVDVAP
ncbi:MAG TPA: deoxyribodipyrimidine photo-lyase [Actinomycetota bacterium]|jgi:deoxyribodipyrimidine photo-lyase|nr:deoxyribodipyrimidine photo-lyase [Actinomycetota bacterium]